MPLRCHEKTHSALLLFLLQNAARPCVFTNGAPRPRKTMELTSLKSQSTYSTRWQNMAALLAVSLRAPYIKSQLLPFVRVTMAYILYIDSLECNNKVAVLFSFLSPTKWPSWLCDAGEWPFFRLCRGWVGASQNTTATILLSTLGPPEYVCARRSTYIH